jgi:hypothetical protein
MFDIASTWSKDGGLIYGLTRTPAGSVLASLDIKSGAIHSIREFGPELRFETSLAHALRLSLNPDGKSFATTTLQVKSDLWMLEGFR